MTPSPIRPVALIALAVSALALAGCATDTDATEPKPDDTGGAVEVHWSYSGDNGPDHWGELTDDFATCAAGESQSPIDLPAVGSAHGDQLTLDYLRVAENVTNTGHTFQLNAEDRAEVDYNDVQYELAQMHFHDPSEHTVAGEHAPIEFHFVNKDADGNLLVVGVLAVEGDENPGFAPFVSAAADDSADPVEGSIDLSALLPTSTDHYAYSGSLTTPPCSENVQWIVMKTPVQLGSEQIATLQTAYAANNRPTQPLNGRDVFEAATELEG